MDKIIKIIIVDDHEIFRNGLKMVLNKLPHINVVAEAPDGYEFLDIIRTTPADVVLMDIEMPNLNGIDATKIALKEFPNLKIIALTMFKEEDYIQSMLDVGVKGFLIKNVKKDTLNKAITQIYNGDNYFSEELFSYFTKQVTKETKPQKEVIKLTKREKEILQLLAEGLSNKEIAGVLFISERTVIGHKTNLLSKTGCKSAVSLLSYAIKNKLVII